MTTTRNIYQGIVSRNRRGYIRDLVAGALIAVGLAAGASALTLSPLPSAETMDAVLKANPPTSEELAAWACASGDEASCEEA